MQDKFNIINLAFADSQIPKQEKDYTQHYIKFGDKNDYPAYLLNLFNKSGKNNAIINGKSVYIFGNGFEDNTIKPNEKQTLNEFTRAFIQDVELFGGCYIQCLPTFGGGWKYYKLEYNNVRSDENNTRFFYCKDFTKPYQNKVTDYPCYNKDVRVASILYYKEYRSGNKTYALPSWVSCCNYIEADIEISKATLTNAKAGFSPTKLINFFNGNPDERAKNDIDARFEKVYAGSEGKKYIIGHNDDPARKPTVDDLGSSDLTKEDFTAVDNLITNNIFSGHNITHPLLFGIQQEGKLGNATELKIAFDIFKNTYANAKQQNTEAFIKYLFGVELKLVPIEPVGLELNVVDFKDMLPKEYIFEKLGIDLTKYPIAPTQPTATTIAAESVNNTLTNLSGRQMQGISRIVRQFTQGKLTKEQAAIMLKNGFGFNDDDVNAYLGIDDDPQTNDATKFNIQQQFSENEVAEMFMSCGVNANEFEVLESESCPPNELDEKFGILTTIWDKIKKLVKPDNVLPNVKIMYSYEKRPEASGNSIIPTTRPFCRAMVTADKFWTRQEIQQLSERLGYSVFKRNGGFWFHDGKADPQCRHEWRRNTVIEKTN